MAMIHNFALRNHKRKSKRLNIQNDIQKINSHFKDDIQHSNSIRNLIFKIHHPSNPHPSIHQT